MTQPRRVFIGAGIMLLAGLCALAAAQSPEPATPALEPTAPLELRLRLGEVKSLVVTELERVAIGNPEIIEINILHEGEILVHAKTAGSTNLILWEKTGQKQMAVIVEATTKADVEQALAAVGVTGLTVNEDAGKLFVAGEVAGQAQFDQVQEVLGQLANVTPLLTLKPAPPPPVPPTPMVDLAVNIVEISRNATDNWGVDWVDSVKVTETTFSAPDLVSSSLADRVTDLFRVGSYSRGGLDATLNFLVKQGKGRVLAAPHLATASGKTATSLVGGEVPIITATSVTGTSGTVSQNVEFKKVGVTLDMTPNVLADGRIATALKAEVSSIDTTTALSVQGTKVPGFKVRRAETNLITASGDTIVIAGLLQEEDKKNIEQLPALGNIPIFGNLFKSTSFQRDLTELIIVVTPTVMGKTPSAETAMRQLEGLTAPPASATGSALDESPLTPTTLDPVTSYVLQVQERIASGLEYPEALAAQKITGKVKLKMQVLKDGSLGKVMVSESSGYPTLDVQALSTAELQAPYPAFPRQIAKQELWLDVPVTFEP